MSLCRPYLPARSWKAPDSSLNPCFTGIHFYYSVGGVTSRPYRPARTLLPPFFLAGA
ncbi:MAG: hypothetical protein H5U05_08540 [Candidatus Aminicenantes bacterium]|nr:hypothetical protein [Candidatus Aminicenantes bacterium]